MIPIPLGTRLYKNKSLPASTQNLINMYVEILDSDNKSQVVCHARMGKTLFANTGNGPIRGQYKFNGVEYTVSGTDLYSISSNGVVSASLGTIPGTGNVSMAANLVNQLCIVNGTITAYYYDGSTFSTATMTGAAYTVKHADGYFIFDKTGTENWFISSNTNGKVFDSTETGATNKKQDNTVAIESAQNRVFVFNEDSVEGFYVVTSLDFPYAKDHGVTFDKGLLARWSLAKVDDVLLFLGSDREVYLIQGLQAKRISDPNISYELSKFSTLTDAEGHAYNWLGHTFYELSFPTENKTYTYDLTTGLWSEWGDLSNGKITRDKGHNHVFIYNKHLVGDHSNGNIYAMDPDVYTDNGDTIKWEMTLPPIHADQENLFIGDILISMEAGVGLATGQGSDPQLFLSRSEDGKIFPSSSVRWAPVGKIGRYKDKVIFRRNGYTTDQIFYRLGGSDPVKWAINGVYIDI